MFADLAFILFRAFFTQYLQSQKETNEPQKLDKFSSYASSKNNSQVVFQKHF